MSRITTFIFAALFATGLGCAHAPDLSPTGETLSDETPSELNPAGFLSDYSKLSSSKIPEHKGAFVFRDRTTSFAIYKIVMLDPVVVHLRPGAAGRKQTPEELRNLAKFFESKLRDNLADSFPVVDQPGWGVMRVRAAIVEAAPKMPVTKGIDSTPVVGATGIEMEILDSLSGKQIAAVVDTRPGKWYRLRNLTENDGYAKELLSQWAVLLRDGLDDARGLHRGIEFRKPESFFSDGLN